MYLTRCVGFALSLSLLLCLAACGDDVAGPGGGSGGGWGSDAGPVDGEPAGLAGITAAHNEVRAKVAPAPSSPLPPLVWSNTLGAAAADHAAGCVWEHSGNQYGENIYASAGSVPGASSAVGSWASEASDYDYASNSCAAGEVCGHYTQVVWRDSTELGCALQKCETGSPFDAFPTWYFVVCNYNPPGNFSGNKPY